MIESWQILDLLTALVEKSLVIYDEDEKGRGRYRLLETVRQYGRHRLDESGGDGSLRTRHRDFFARFWDDAAPGLTGPHQADTLARLEAEHDNLRASLDLPPGAAPDEVETCLHLAAAAFPFCDMRGYLSEARMWLTGLLAAQTEPTQTVTRGRALNAVGSLAWRQGDYALAQTFLEEARTLWQALDDPVGLAPAVNNLANVAWYQGDYDRAEVLYDEFLRLARQTGDQKALATALNNLGLVAQGKSDHPGARACFEEGLTIRRALGDRRGIANLLGNLSQTLMDAGDIDAARPLVAESLAVRRALGDRLGLAYALQYQGRIALADDDGAGARTAFAESLTLRAELGEKWGVAAGLERFVELAVRQNKWARAVRLQAAADALCAAIGAPVSDGSQSQAGTRRPPRAALGESVFALARSVGQIITWEQAVADALNTDA